MAALIVGVPAAIMAMLSAIIGIRITEAYFNRTTYAHGDIEDGHSANRRCAHFSQCAQYSHVLKYITSLPAVSNADNAELGAKSMSAANRVLSNRFLIMARKSSFLASLAISCRSCYFSLSLSSKESSVSSISGQSCGEFAQCRPGRVALDRAP